jgi:hypothetical protein
MRLIFLLLFLGMIPLISASQNSDTSATKNKIAGDRSKPEILTSGFIDIVSNGQLTASARLIRIFVGDPENICIPLSLYSGVSSNNFQSSFGASAYSAGNDHLLIQFINPLSGLMNISSDGLIFFKSTSKPTKLGWLYQTGERVLTGFVISDFQNPRNGKPVTFLNTFFSTGIYFQTGAWERNNAKNVGICWSALRYHGCYTNPNQIKEFLPNVKSNGFYSGYSIGFGIDITNLVNIKVICYKYIKQPELDYSSPLYQFSFNYALK